MIFTFAAGHLPYGSLSNEATLVPERCKSEIKVFFEELPAAWGSIVRTDSPSSHGQLWAHLGSRWAHRWISGGDVVVAMQET
jgi:hypothetical protein